MLKIDKFLVVNIRRYLDKKEVGENRLMQVLSRFSCPRNLDVERFLKKNAIEFTKKNQSVTYLVFSLDNDNMDLVGYFSIALKPLTVRGETVSNTVKKKLLRVSEFDTQTQSYTMSAYLIAQLGKNFTNGLDKKIAGEELLELAWKKIEQMQYMSGGMVVFLEANNEERLLNFYRNNRFQQFDTRLTALNENEPHELIQMLRLL